ncbi:iron ABC transporter permease [Ponticaulis sp.]|uniref:FecCD family ABC transporter permease n=1 Tax=Ponticaulis sp. TaxID=2020902 RepID=UPI000B63EAD4|nr:iron ABC transporter permease [Ponticaulis sp.]MAI91824.1 ABC transporter permease [Ponticaulis sp.]OUX96695.1 MAG: ABC transporter permease [Hyphomonadaceae bacterium TMED5]|tara:strand:+ start:23746 stop:24741 length:996 start_codon:yes stop_codon:yes gene_type:complete
MTRDFYLNGALVVLACLGLFLACLLGSTSLSVGSVMDGLLGQGAPENAVIVWQIRLPRAIAALVTGAALGMSGAALQGLLRNPLAEPGVLGVSAMSVLFATLVIYFGLASVNGLALPLAAIAGALVATALLAFAAFRTGSVVTLILIGVGISSFSGAFMSLILNFAPNPFTLSDMVNWTLGSVANRSLADLTYSLPFILMGMALLLVSRNGLSALTLGEEAAAGIGLNLTRQRLLVITGAGLATGGSIALAGAIGFVGIITPHAIRPFVGHDPSRTLLPSALAGGVLLVFADILIRILPTYAELKLGVVAALIGAPAFIWIAVQNRRGAVQ